MARYKFYNIGAANQRIAELEQELEAAKAATPDKQLETSLTDAVASNEDIANKLSAATAENTKLNESVAELTNKCNKLDTDFAAVTSALNQACARFEVADADKLGVTDKIAALEKSVANAVAAIGIKTEKVPAAAATENKTKTVSRADFEKMNFAARNEFIRSGGKVTE